MATQEKVENVKHELTKICGELPPAGQERGKYFQTIKEQFPAFNHKLISMILSPKEFRVDHLLKLFEGKNLLFVLSEMNKIEW